MNISVIGLGYVGLANDLLLSQKENVMAYDIISSKIDSLNKKNSPIEDKEISEFLRQEDLKIQFSKDYEETILLGNILFLEKRHSVEKSSLNYLKKIQSKKSDQFF